MERRTWVKSWLEGSKTVILQHVKESLSISTTTSLIHIRGKRTVFPALSRPRNKSFAPGHQFFLVLFRLWQHAYSCS